jgi:hypothetical protein
MRTSRGSQPDAPAKYHSEHRWHDAPELVDLAVVPGDLAGDEGQQRDGNRDERAAVQEVQLQRGEHRDEICSWHATSYQTPTSERQVPLQRQVLAIGVLMSVLAAPALRAQAPAANPADVTTIPALVRAFYEVISGPAGAPRTGAGTARCMRRVPRSSRWT